MINSNTNRARAEDFSLVAQEYCDFIDSLEDGRPENLYSRLEFLLAKLHISILPLQADTNETEQTEPERITHAEWKVVASSINETINRETNQLFQWHEECWKTSDLKDNYCAIRASMLWDDLADIYRDLIDGLVWWKLNTTESRIEAAWHWRTNYEIHWGNHLYRALQTVHESRYHLYAN